MIFRSRVELPSHIWQLLKQTSCSNNVYIYSCYAISLVFAMDRDTPQYNAVLQNLVALVSTIIATPSALDLLKLEFASKKWLHPIAKPDADDLTKLALNNIAMSTENYEVFLEMLKKVGLTGIVTTINGMLVIRISIN